MYLLQLLGAVAGMAVFLSRQRATVDQLLRTRRWSSSRNSHSKAGLVPKGASNHAPREQAGAVCANLS